MDDPGTGGTVLGQDLSTLSDSDLLNLAKSKNISVPKTQDLSALSDSDLLGLAKQKGMDVSSIVSPSDKKPWITGILPKSLQGYFPSPSEAQQMRSANGLPTAPGKPVSEYSPEEELLLGSAIAPGAVPLASGAASGLISKAGQLGSGFLQGAQKALPYLTPASVGTYAATKTVKEIKGLLSGH